MKLYRTLPRTVEAHEWTGKNPDETREFLGYVPAASAFLGFYVRRGGRIEFHPPEEFHARFEPLIEF